ncbi:MAG: tetratricopeptide repeat protein [Sphingobacteriales bacterium]|nr:MAG: tetratricopeptide repeat protein [Sphingobacteriales bacterium]
MRILMLARVLLLLLLACFTSQSFGQRNKPLIDSLERLTLKQSDSALATTYSELAWQYRSLDRTKAISYGRKAIAQSKKTGFKRGLAQAYNDLGILYFDKELYDSSVILYKEALKIREQLKDEHGQAKIYNKLGIVYQKQGEFATALEYQLKALPGFENAGDNIGTSYTLNNIGILNQNMSRYDEALKYHKRSVDIKQRINDRAGLAQSYVNVGNIYKILGDNANAETYYEDALVLANAIGNKEYISNIQNNLGELYIRKKDYDKAISIVSASYKIREEIGDTKGVVSCLNNLAMLYIDMSRYDTARAVLKTAEQIAERGVNTRPELMFIYQTYARLYEATGNATHALDFYKRHISVKDTLYTDEVGSKFAELETRYKTLQKDQQIQRQYLALEQNRFAISQQKLQLSEAGLEIAENELEIKKQKETILQQQLDSARKEMAIQALHKQNQVKELELRNQKLAINRRNILLMAIVAVSGLGALLTRSYYRRYRLMQNARLQAVVMQQQELATRAVLDAEENERKRIAGDLHDTVGQMMSAAKINLSMLESDLVFDKEEQRVAYHKVLALVDESCREVRTVSHNIMPNALLKSGLANGVRDFINRIDDRFIKIDLFIDGLHERIDPNVEAVLYRVVQECVNNVIKHSGANKLDISIIKDEESISATLEDNGKGFDTTDTTKFEGIGLKNIITRIKFLKGSVEWNSAPGRGTLVAIYVPYDSNRVQ